MTRKIVGIDPGKTGAIAVYAPESGWLEVYDVPTITTKNSKGRLFKRVDVDALMAIRNQIGRYDVLVVERVGARPGEAPSYAFDFGYTTGLLLGAFLPAPSLLTPTPAVWKASLNVSPIKDEARQRATELFAFYGYLWPRKKDDGRAEAAMLALWGARNA